MNFTFSTFGAVIGLLVAIVLIVKNFHPAYSLIFGALIGGILGGGGLSITVAAMIKGAEGMMSPVLRILTSGILAGCLVKTGAAEKIANVIIETLGEKKALAAIAVSTMIICAVGVFIDIAVITCAPIAIAVGHKSGIHKNALLLAMIGGGKAGNVISPNPNTIATAEAFHLNLTSLMTINILPAIVALIVTICLSLFLSKRKGIAITVEDLDDAQIHTLPGFFQSVIGPLVVILLLALRPLVGITVDPLIALPVGGIVCLLFTSHLKNVGEFSAFGFSKVIGVCALLIGTGTIAGIIKTSHLQHDMVNLIHMLNMPAFLLAPISGILMAAATASTTAGSTIASQTFAKTLLSANIPAINGAAMIHAGATVLDSLPHGSFFHATGGSVRMSISHRLKLIPYEAMVGLSTTIISVIIYLVTK